MVTHSCELAAEGLADYASAATDGRELVVEHEYLVDFFHGCLSRRTAVQTEKGDGAVGVSGVKVGWLGKVAHVETEETGFGEEVFEEREVGAATFVEFGVELEHLLGWGGAIKPFLRIDGATGWMFFEDVK